MKHPLTRCVAGLTGALSRLSRDGSGNVLLIFGLAAVPLIGITGFGVEYVRGINYRSHLDRASDAATIAAITAARDYISTNPKNETDPTASAKALGYERGMAAFRANAGSVLSSVPTTPDLVVTRTGNAVSATANYSSRYSTSFGKVIGSAGDIPIAGKSAASLTLGNYTDFYLLVDTSGSMGFPTSKEGQLRFAKLNPDMKGNLAVNNCAFACHFPGFVGVKVAADNNIELRIKTVSNAVQQLIAKAKARQTLTNQYKIGIYPFVSNLETAMEATNNLDSLKSIDLDDYQDIGDFRVPRGSGGTHYENIFPSLNAKIIRIGDGSSAAKPIPYVFFITDGIRNNQYYAAPNWTGTQPNLLNPANCQLLKSRGIMISVLYIPYVPLEKPFNPQVDWENTETNKLIPSVPQTLQSCASPGFYRAASTASEIEAALNAMFDQATRQARLVD